MKNFIKIENKKTDEGKMRMDKNKMRAIKTKKVDHLNHLNQLIKEVIYGF